MPDVPRPRVRPSSAPRRGSLGGPWAGHEAGGPRPGRGRGRAGLGVIGGLDGLAQWRGGSVRGSALRRKRGDRRRRAGGLGPCEPRRAGLSARQDTDVAGASARSGSTRLCDRHALALVVTGCFGGVRARVGAERVSSPTLRETSKGRRACCSALDRPAVGDASGARGAGGGVAGEAPGGVAGEAHGEARPGGVAEAVSATRVAASAGASAASEGEGLGSRRGPLRAAAARRPPSARRASTPRACAWI